MYGVSSVTLTLGMFESFFFYSHHICQPLLYPSSRCHCHPFVAATRLLLGSQQWQAAQLASFPPLLRSVHRPSVIRYIFLSALVFFSLASDAELCEPRKPAWLTNLQKHAAFLWLTGSEFLLAMMTILFFSVLFLVFEIIVTYCLSFGGHVLLMTID